MNFLNPGVLIAIAPLLALPLVIHLFNRHFPHAIRFPNIDRIRKSLSERSKLARWRHILMTLLRTLLVLLALFAFLKPVLPTFGSKPGDAFKGRKIVMVLDRSLSMEYQSGARTSAAKNARIEIGKVLDTLGGNDDVSVVLAGSTARTLLPDFTSNHGEISSQIAVLPPGFENADVTKAIALVETLIADGKEAPSASELYFFSDFQRRNWGVSSFDGLPKNTRLFFVDTADDMDRPNTAITRVEPSATEVASGDVVSLDVTVANWTGEPVIIPVEAVVGGASSVSDEVSLAPFSSGRTVLEFVAPGEGFHAIEVRSPDDGLAFDNHHYLTLEVRQREDILILTDTKTGEGGAMFVAAALNPYEGTGGAFLPQVLPTAAVTPGLIASTKKIVLSGVGLIPPDVVSRLMAFVESGGGLIYFLDGESDRENLLAFDSNGGRGVVPFQVAGKLTTENFGGEPQKIAKGNFKNRFLRLFRGENRQALGLLDFYAVQRALPTEEGEIILHFADGTPALGVSEIGIGTAVFANFTPAELSSNLARQRLFPAWMQELVKNLTPATTPDGTADVGSTLIANVWRSDFQKHEFTGPDGSTIIPKIVGDGEQVTASFPGNRPGIYRLGPANAAVWSNAVNIDGDIESDLRSIEEEELMARAESAPAESGHFVKGAEDYEEVTRGKPIFHWFLVALAAFLLIEMLLYRPFQKASGQP